MCLWLSNHTSIQKLLKECHNIIIIANLLNAYHREHLNPYINFHRPCFFPVATIDRKGKVKNTYPYNKIKTPNEKLKPKPQFETYLRP